ncbi:MAG TPA: LuxR C-terminal-related transcriptional regulator [Streptosporangiaceae bacterium]|nr:LuxR C-terminal-related transcriptional regulator [Streptosporangiaceae bacterium]
MATQTFTFLFTDVEGSTAMVRRLGNAYARVLADHHRLIRRALAARDGDEVVSQGDGFFAVFASPRSCVDAAVQAQRALVSHPWPAGERVLVRMGIHSGEASRTAAGLVGLEVHRAARIAAVAHGGQVLVSAAAAALLGGSLPAGVWLKDLGLHRLKDVGGPEHIFQLQAEGLPAAFPPLRSLDNPKLHSNLPAQVSSFIGRDRELAEVCALISGSRLVTLTGAGGAGKTRLALQVAAMLAAGGRDDVWFAELAPLGDPDLVAVAVADLLGIRQEPGRQVLDTLVEAVGGRSLLIVLDNCEHVIGACAKLADALVRGCPNLTLLATSREPLGIDGERVFRVPSMGTPADGDDAEAIRASEAVRLLEDRAAAQGVTLGWDVPAAEVAGRICRRLDGIPLAVELAAARLRVMPAAELDARLDERFALLTGGSRAGLPRQQTLRAMVDWSWELLTSAERAVLARLSVFAGGFGLGAAEAIAVGPGMSTGEVAGHLGALVDKSLVQFGDTGAGPGRYRLLETVRQYSAGRLDTQVPAVADAARMAHRDYYLALAEAAAPQLRAADQAEWLNRLDAELGNLRAAMAFSLTQADPEPGLRLGASLRVYWEIRGHATEGAGMLQALLDAPAAQGTTLLRARALAAAAELLTTTGGYAASGNYCDEALGIARAAGDDYLATDLLHERASILLCQGEPEAALPLIESGLRLARSLDEPRLTGLLLSARSYAAHAQGDEAASRRDAAEAVLLLRRAGDQIHVGRALNNVGYCDLLAGDLAAARRHLAEALHLARALNTSRGAIHGTFNLGLAEYLSGSPDAAGVLFVESLDLARRLGMKAHVAYALIGLALTGRAGAGPGWSARLHGAADQTLADLGHAVEPLEGWLADLDRQRLRTAMGAESFEAEYAAGRALGLPGVLVGIEREDAAAGQARTVAESGEAAAVLTPRELDVLTLVAQGLSNPDIAQRLVLSEHTVHRHVANILRKLNLSSRAAASAWGARTGLV